MGIAFLLMGLSDVPFMHLMTLGPQVVALLHGPQEHQLFLDFLLSVPPNGELSPIASGGWGSDQHKSCVPCVLTRNYSAHAQ